MTDLTAYMGLVDQCRRPQEGFEESESKHPQVNHDGGGAKALRYAFVNKIAG
jgi:hypothetical protein